MITRIGHAPTGHRLAEVNGFVYVSGATALDRSVGMREQTQQILNRLDGFLADGHLERDEIVFATVYLTDMARKAEMDSAWSEYFASDILPARATVGVADLGKDCLVEIQFIAARKN